MNMDAKISFVIIARNDGYIPNYLDKLNLTLSCLAEQALKHELALEALIVEWNPPADHKGLSQCLKKISNSYFSAKIISVPSTYHHDLIGSDDRPIHCLKALNVGFKRASGEFITPLASDVLLSNSIFEYFKTNGLNKKHVYRLDRCDVNSDSINKLPLNDWSQTALEEVCNKNILQRYQNQDETFKRDYGIKPLHTNACGDFLLMPKTAWHNMHGYQENCHVACLDGDSLGLYAAVSSGLEEVRLDSNCVVFKFSHPKMTTNKVSVTDNLSNTMKRKFIKTITKDKIQQKYWSNILDWPRRGVSGFSGTFPSMERNFTSKARKWMGTPGKQIHLSDSDWGLGDIKLPTTNI